MINPRAPRTYFTHVEDASIPPGEVRFIKGTPVEEQRRIMAAIGHKRTRTEGVTKVIEERTTVNVPPAPPFPTQELANAMGVAIAAALTQAVQDAMRPLADAIAELKELLAKPRVSTVTYDTNGEVAEIVDRRGEE